MSPVAPGLRARIGPALATVPVVAAGLAARRFLTGFSAKYLGVALYATLVYVLVILIRPALPIRRAALVALAVSFAVELAQLSPVPAWLSSKHLILRMIFGTTFSAWDLLAYAAGVALGAGVHAWIRRPAA